MNFKNLLPILIAIVLTLVFFWCISNADFVDVEESSDTVIVSTTEIISDTSPQIETDVETSFQTEIETEIETETETEIETEIESTTETAPEDDYIFYDVPFDIDTQKEIMKICSEYGFYYELILGMISVESAFRPDVIGDGGNSFGLMQIQPQWWGEIMEREGVTNLLDPLQNIRCGCAILRELKDKYGTEYRTLQAYNTGRPDTNNGYAEKVYRHVSDLEIYGG